MAIGIFVRQSSLVSGGQAEVAKPESEIYERERGQTKKSKLAGGLTAPTNISTRTLFLFPRSLLIGRERDVVVAAWLVREKVRFWEFLEQSFEQPFSVFLHSRAVLGSGGEWILQYSRFIFFSFSIFCIEISCLVPISVLVISQALRNSGH